jgi:hypothetical protein
MAAVWVASTKGVAQFAGRVVEILFARNLRAITVGRIAVGVLPPSLLLLLVGTGSLPLIVAFTLLMGASQGVITIVRGAVPLALFGAKGYGAVHGPRVAPGQLLRGLARHGADVALVRAPPSGRRRRGRGAAYDVIAGPVSGRSSEWVVRHDDVRPLLANETGRRLGECRTSPKRVPSNEAAARRSASRIMVASSAMICGSSWPFRREADIVGGDTVNTVPGPDSLEQAPRSYREGWAPH